MKVNWINGPGGSLCMKETLIEALKQSGKELKNYLGKDTGFKVKESQSSILTIADLKSDSLIVGMIRERFPLHNIISEESGFNNRDSEYTWVIDPLDGTSNYASGLPWFGVLITLFKNAEPVMAGAYLPVQDILYYAARNEGAFKNGKIIKMKKQTVLKNALCAFSVDFTDDTALLERSISIYRNVVKESRNIRSTNSLVDFLYVAEGKFGCCINLFTKIWDISGLGLIMSEAGGALKDISGEDIQYAIDESCLFKNFAVMSGSEEILNEIRRSVLKISQ